MRKILKYERKKRRLTQKELAKKLQISEITVRSLENGTRDPSISMAIKYVKYFEKNFDLLFSDIFCTLQMHDALNKNSKTSFHSNKPSGYR